MKLLLKILLNCCALLFLSTTLVGKDGPSSPNVFKSGDYLSHNLKSQSSKSGSAHFLFNGQDSYLELNEKFDSTFTFCAWIKPKDLLKKNLAIVGIPDAFWFRTTTTRELQFTQPGIHDSNTDGLLLSADNWIFVSLLINFPSTKVYVNTRLVGEFKWMGEKMNWQNKLLIGKDNWREDFHGAMHNIYVSKEVISEGQMNMLFQNKPYADPIKDGIVLYHSFNSIHEYSASGREAETHKLEFVNDSLRGKVGHFNGNDTYVEFGELPVDNAITISAWVKQSRFNRDYGAIAALGHAYAFRITTGGALLFTIPQMADVWDVNARLQRNKWQHIAVSFKEQKGVTFYLNGQKTGFFEEEKFQTVPKALQIGTNLWNDFLKGEMDDLLIWNKVLNEEEMQTVYKKEGTYWEDSIGTKKSNTLIMLVFVLLFLAISLFLLARKNKNKSTGSAAVSISPFEKSIQETVLQNLSDSNFSVKEFAESMNMSKTKLYNEIKATVGQSPKEYIRETRMVEAARLLRETDIPVSEVIIDTGFESRAYFNKCFKEKYNSTPSAYRKNTPVSIRLSVL